MNKKIIITTIILSLIMVSGCGCSRKNTISDTGIYFDTVIQITLYDSDYQYALDHCMEMAAEYEGYFSDRIATSDVSKINSHPGKAIKVHAETAELISKALDYSKESKGSFDLTVGKLTKLWDFNPDDDEEQSVPDGLKIKKITDGIDYRKVKVRDKSVTLKSGDCSIDLGGIAKGYIADRMKNYLKSEGINSGLINLGGNVLTLEEKPDGTDYTIGIQKPFSEDKTPAVSIDVVDKSVVTSGTYQRYFKQGGKLYHHILDTSSGYPADTGLDSVTIISDTSTKGDALSTTVFLMGLDEGMKYIEAHDDLEAIFITTTGERYYSSGMGKAIPYKEY